MIVPIRPCEKIIKRPRLSLLKWERTDKRCWLLQNSFPPVQTQLRLMSLRKMAVEVVVVGPFITGSVTLSAQMGSSRPFSGWRVENTIFSIGLLLLSMSDSHVFSMRPRRRLWLSAVSLILFVLVKLSCSSQIISYFRIYSRNSRHNRTKSCPHMQGCIIGVAPSVQIKTKIAISY